MTEQVLRNEEARRAIAFCCAPAGDMSGMQRQNEILSKYAKENRMEIGVTFNSNTRMDSFVYRSLRLRAKYREFDVLLIAELDMLGNSPIEIMHEINFLNENGVKAISVKDGELNSTSLPVLFRRMLRLLK